MNEEKKIVKVKLVKHEWPDERKKRHQKYLKRVGLGILAIVLFAGGIFIGVGISSNESSPLLSNKLNAVFRIMNEKWYFGNEIEDLEEQLLDDAIYGMTSQERDLFTSYMDAQTSKKFLGSMEGDIVGIGIQYNTALENYMVLRVFTDSPAEKAGIRSGDVIVKVGGVPTEDIEDISSAVKGKAGTQVIMTVQRGSETLDLVCTRESIDTSANGYIIGDTGILELLSIADNTAIKVGEILSSFDKQGIKKIIVDLRDNGGGYLTSVVDIASYFLPQDSVVLQEKDKNGNIIADKTNSRIVPYTYDKIAVLINQDTASAAEVLALALKETMDVTIIGDVSYGKGTIQTTLPFSDGSMLKYTKAIWLSPNGNSINKVGITPDILVETEKALLMGMPTEFEPVKVDSVSAACMSMQTYLDYLGYEVGRTDGYFSEKTLQALLQFEKDHGLQKQEELDQDLLMTLYGRVVYESNVNEQRDTQMLKALENMK